MRISTISLIATTTVFILIASLFHMPLLGGTTPSNKVEITTIPIKKIEREYSLYSASIWEMYRREGFEAKPYKGPEGGKENYIGYGTRINEKQAEAYNAKPITKSEAAIMAKDKYQQIYDKVSADLPDTTPNNVLYAITNVAYNCGFSRFKYKDWYSKNPKTHTNTYQYFIDGNYEKGGKALLSWCKYDKNNDGKTEAHERSTNLLQSRQFDYCMVMEDWEKFNNYTANALEHQDILH